MSVNAKVTIWMLIGFAAILGGWEIYVIFTALKGDTISEVNLRYGGLIAFCTGFLVATPPAFLLGHLYWPQKEETK